MKTVDPSWPNIKRAARYRERAAALRDLALAEPAGSLRENLLKIAEQYDDLSISIEALQQPMPAGRP
jgi:hypothetical protein